MYNNFEILRVVFTLNITTNHAITYTKTGSFHHNPKDFTRLTAREMYNNFEISRVVFTPNITTNHAITYTKTGSFQHNPKD